MSAKTLDGVAVAAAIRAEVAEKVRQVGAGMAPGLAVILAGNNPASEVYVRGKIRACHEVGIRSEQILASAQVTTAELLAEVAALNARDDIDGILVQLPLPPQVDAAAVLLAVSPAKDVDGFHPVNLGNLVTQRPGLVPCTPAGIVQLLERSGIAIAGREAVVVGRSDIVGKPVALLLMHQHATVTICHSRTPDLAKVCQRADILVAAIGRPAMINEKHIRRGAVVVDVGINRITDAAQVDQFFPGPGAENTRRRAEFAKRGSTLIGDVDPRAACALAEAYTPVPGGVGPLTIAMLMSNTWAAASARRGH